MIQDYYYQGPQQLSDVVPHSSKDVAIENAEFQISPRNCKSVWSDTKSEDLDCPCNQPRPQAVESLNGMHTIPEKPKDSCKIPKKPKGLSSAEVTTATTHRRLRGPLGSLQLVLTKSNVDHTDKNFIATTDPMPQDIADAAPGHMMGKGDAETNQQIHGITSGSPRDLNHPPLLLQSLPTQRHRLHW